MPSTGGRVVLTRRDTTVLGLLAVVRVATPAQIGVWLGIASGEPDKPRSTQKVSRWLIRMLAAGQIERYKPVASPSIVTLHPGSLLADDQRRRVNPLGATIRHEIAVSDAFTVYMLDGWEVEPPEEISGHRPDLMAVKDGRREAVEVELSPKTKVRLRGIQAGYVHALARGTQVHSVTYLCTPRAATSLSDTLDRLHPADRARYRVWIAYDPEGRALPRPWGEYKTAAEAAAEEADVAALFESLA